LSPDFEKQLLGELAEIHNRLSEILAELRDSKARQKIADRTPPAGQEPAKIERKISKCGSKNFQGCGADIIWKDRKPFNPDGTAHRCM
jgi:hypothetical protein